MKPKVAFLTMEMLLPDLPEPYCGANFRGGLGILSGDIMAGMPDARIEGVGFTPLYHRPWFNKNIELAYDNYTEVKRKIVVEIDGQNYVISNREFYRGNQLVHGIECPEILDVLYTENRRKRMFQEILVAKAAIEILKVTDFCPNVVWLNESHTALVIALLRSSPVFSRTKTLFTIHTPEHAGMERFYDYRFESLGIDPEQYRPIFVKDGVLDFTWAAMVLADAVNAVSEEHCEVTQSMFRQFSSKISAVRNGTDSRFWTYPELTQLIDRGEPITASDLLKVHHKARLEAFHLINNLSCLKLKNEEKPRAWFIRRLAAYKNLYPMLVQQGVIYAVCAERGTKVNTPLGQLEGLGMQVIGAGMAAETDNTCLWWMAEFNRVARDDLSGKFVFLPAYSLELLKVGAWGSDVWLVTPEPRREACSTSDQRAIINGIPVITTNTGGMKEYIKEFNPDAGEGNGFLLEPYNSKTLYEKLRLFSNLWYDWHNDSRADPYSRLKLNAFNVGRSLDIQHALRGYKKLIIKVMK